MRATARLLTPILVMAMLLSTFAVLAPPGVGLVSAAADWPAEVHHLEVLNTNTTTPIFEWSYYDPEGATAAGWELEVWSGPAGTGTQMWIASGAGEGGSVVYDSDGLALPLVAATMYYVRARASDGSGFGPWTETGFSVMGTPAGPGPEVVCVPWKGMEVLFHPTWDGLEITLKGTVRYAGDISWTWSFGDVSGPVTGAAIVGDDYPYPIEAKHVYNGPIGATFVAVLNVTATSGGAVGATASDAYRVKIRDGTLRRTRADVAIDEGLWWLYKHQSRSTIGYVDIGHWGATGVDKKAFDLYLQTNYPVAYAAAEAAGEAAGEAAFQNELADSTGGRAGSL